MIRLHNRVRCLERDGLEFVYMCEHLLRQIRLLHMSLIFLTPLLPHLGG